MEASSKSRLYLPALPAVFREATAAGKLLWVRACEEQAPILTQILLESGLCEGVLVRELDKFSRVAPAALWGRRWQLAAHKGASHLLWVHQTRHPVIGFEARVEWTGPGHFEIKKGYGFFKASAVQGRKDHGIVVNDNGTHGSAA